MLYSQNDEKKAGEVEKIKPYRRNLAKFLAKNRDIRQNRKARFSSRQSFKTEREENTTSPPRLQKPILPCISFIEHS